MGPGEGVSPGPKNLEQEQQGTDQGPGPSILFTPDLSHHFDLYRCTSGQGCHLHG